MSLYSLALFARVVGALLLFITLALRGLRQATTLTQVGEWAKVAGLTRLTRKQ